MDVHGTAVPRAIDIQATRKSASRCPPERGGLAPPWHASTIALAAHAAALWAAAARLLMPWSAADTARRVHSSCGIHAVMLRAAPAQSP